MAAKLESSDLQARLAKLPGWKAEGDAIAKTFTFDNFYETMSFVNAVAHVANRRNHHPDLEVGYAKCVVRFTTHDSGGVTEKDIEAASEVERLA